MSRKGRGGKGGAKDGSRRGKDATDRNGGDAEAANEGTLAQRAWDQIWPLAIAVLISTTTINIVRVVELWVLLRVLPWDRRSWKPIVAAAVTTGLGLLALEPLPEVLGLGLLVVVSVGLGAVFLAMFVAFGLDPDDRLVVARVREKLRTVGRKGSTEPVASGKS